jgi:hypothetical protein
MSQDVTHLLPEALGDDLEPATGILLDAGLSAESLPWSSHPGSFVRADILDVGREQAGPVTGLPF